jgi:hypothetical protein
MSTVNWVDVTTDGQSAYPSWCRAPLWAHDQILLFPFFCRTIALLFDLRRPPWREAGSAICSAICQWSESRRTRNHTLLSHLRLLSFLFIASYNSQGLRWKYSNPPPHGARALCSYAGLHRPPWMCMYQGAFLNWKCWGISMFESVPDPRCWMT